MNLPKLNQFQADQGVLYGLDNEGVLWIYENISPKKDKNKKSKGWKRYDDYILEE